MPDAAPIERRRLLAGAVVAGGALLGASACLPNQQAQAVRQASPTPRVYTRKQWHARAPKVAATVLDKGPDHIVVHHTASENATDHSLEHAFALSRSIQDFHMDDNGWDDTGQQLTISRGGYLMEGRNHSLEAIAANKHVVGAHTLSHNEHTIGIENEGTYMTVEPTAELWGQLTQTCAWLCETYDLDPFEAIVGHRDYNDTACPGDKLYARLPQLRSAVAALLNIERPARAPRRLRTGTFPGPRHRFDHGPALAPNASPR